MGLDEYTPDLGIRQARNPLKKILPLGIRKFNGRKKKEKLLCMAYVLHEDRLLGEPSEDGNLYTKIRECNGLTSNIIRIGMKLLIP